MKGLHSFFIESPSRIPFTGFCAELFIILMEILKEVHVADNVIDLFAEVKYLDQSKRVAYLSLD